MRRLERGEGAPRILKTKTAQDSRRAMRGFMALERERRAQTSVPVVGLDARMPKLVEAVSAMSGGRCAFCEATDDIIVHRFRPSGNALPLQPVGAGHLYYLWLADAWDNLYPICAGCAPIEPHFPVAASRSQLPPLAQIDRYISNREGRWPSHPPKEAPLLLDPVLDDGFDLHLVPKFDGELIGLTNRGEETIAVFNVNRPDRRNQRYQNYQNRLDRLNSLLSAKIATADQTDWQALFAFDEMDFGGTWYLLLKRIARWLNAHLGERRRHTQAQIRSFFEKLAPKDDGGALLRQAVSALLRDDAGLRGGRFAIKATLAVRSPIAAIEFTNFKAIEQLRLVLGARKPNAPDPSQRRTPSLMILGENATGKSSILEGIALALMSDNARYALRPNWSRYILDPSQLGAARGRGARSGQVRVELSTGQSKTLKITPGGAVPDSEFGIEQVPVFAYGAFRRFTSGTRRGVPHARVRNLFDGEALSNPEPWLKGLSRNHFDMVIRTLRDLLSIDGEFEVIQRERSTRQLRMVTSVAKPDGTPQLNTTPLYAVSSGYRAMLAMVCDIMRGLLDEQFYEGFGSFETARGLVLIDEIEAHLHPRWKVQVVSSLRRALPGMTFIVTTHDPLCLRGMGDDEVAVLQRVTSLDSAQISQLPILVERLDQLPPVSDLRIEQLLTSDFFQLFSTDDAAADRKLAKVADLMKLRASHGALSDEDARILGEFERDIASALPVGSTEVHRIVQEAVAEFLQRRRDASNRTLHRLREDAKADILRALELL